MGQWCDGKSPPEAYNLHRPVPRSWDLLPTAWDVSGWWEDVFQIVWYIDWVRCFLNSSNFDNNKNWRRLNGDGRNHLLDLDGMSYPNMTQQYELMLLNRYMSRWKQISIWMLGTSFPFSDVRCRASRSWRIVTTVQGRFEEISQKLCFYSIFLRSCLLDFSEIYTYLFCLWTTWQRIFVSNPRITPRRVLFSVCRFR